MEVLNVLVSGSLSELDGGTKQSTWTVTRGTT